MRNSHFLSHVYQRRSKIIDKINVVSPWHRLYRENTLKAIEKLLPSSGAVVLDAAGGTGIFAEFLVSRGHRVVLFDLLPHMLAVAKTKIERTSPQLEKLALVRGDMTKLAVQDSVFDLVICTQALNFCEDLASIFAEFYRVLKPGGRVFADIDTTYRWCLIEALSEHLDNAFAIAHNGRDVARNIVGADYHFISRSHLVNAVTSTGLELESIWGLLFVAPYIHVFANSENFLSPSKLPKQARLFCDPHQLDKLRRLEEELSQVLPIDIAGWMQFICRKPDIYP